MTYTLRVLPAAEEENAAAIEWLVAHVSSERAAGHVAAISKVLHEILELPLAWPRWRVRPDVRVRHLRDIPYSIFYRVQNRVVLVVAFAHMSRKPGYWLDRIK
jgi:plasmid stabilization system protein ParE